jgi:hypothetical protein
MDDQYIEATLHEGTTEIVQERIWYHYIQAYRDDCHGFVLEMVKIEDVDYNRTTTYVIPWLDELRHLFGLPSFRWALLRVLRDIKKSVQPTAFLWGRVRTGKSMAVDQILRAMKWASRLSESPPPPPKREIDPRFVNVPLLNTFLMRSLARTARAMCTRKKINQ